MSSRIDRRAHHRKRKRKRDSRAATRPKLVKKVHRLDRDPDASRTLHDGSVFRQSLCGRATSRTRPAAYGGFSRPVFDFSFVEGGEILDPAAFQHVPSQAQCRACTAISMSYSASDEEIVTVEAFLHILAQVMRIDFECLEEIPIYSYGG